MAAPHSVDPAALLEQHLADASPDLLRQMIATFANAMMSAQADQICGAGYGERSAERTIGATATGPGMGHPGRHRRAGDPEAARGLVLPGQ
jgi:transposase-like protein